MFKPLLAPGEDPLSYPDFFEKLEYPLLCSPKLDGIRCIVKSSRAMSRSFKMLPSYQVQEEFSKFENFDGELIEGNSTDFDVYNRTQSHVMSENKPGNLTYFVFDHCASEWLNTPFFERLEHTERLVKEANNPNVVFLEHSVIYNHDELLQYEAETLSKGYEGVMMRRPVGYYKCGRATFREGIIYKLKRFKDAEGLLLDILPMMINNNPLETDELGYAKRSSSKAGLEEGDIAGKYIVFYNGMELEVAPGSFNHDQRRDMLKNKDKFIGSHIKFRFFNHGIKDKPRHPRATGMRTSIDL